MCYELKAIAVLLFCLQTFTLERAKRGLNRVWAIDEESSPSPHGGGLLCCIGLAVVDGQGVGAVAMDL